MTRINLAAPRAVIPTPEVRTERLWQAQQDELLPEPDHSIPYDGCPCGDAFCWGCDREVR